MITTPPAMSESAAPLPVRLDARGRCPTLLATRPDGSEVALHGRRDPIADATRWLDTVLHDTDPPVLVVIGLGLGYVLEALERRGSHARVLTLEPFPDGLAHFRARRDWSRWFGPARLQVVMAPSYAGIDRAWRVIDPQDVPPVLVPPVLATHFPGAVAACRGALNRGRRWSRLDPYLTEVKLSMLHPDVLVSLEHFAAMTSGLIVEIGTYVGGATIALARGVRDAGHDTRIVAIQPGGRNPGHPQLPSDDIVGDLRRNLRTRNLDRYVTIHEGLSSAEARTTVAGTLAATGTRIGMLCIDADGEVQRDFDLFLPLCADGCVLSVDDYVAEDVCTKGPKTIAAVDTLVGSGRARPLGVFGYGTWMGIYEARP